MHVQPLGSKKILFIIIETKKPDVLSEKFKIQSLKEKQKKKKTRLNIA